MARNATDTLLRSVRALAAGQCAGNETDHELLERFLRHHHDEAAFSILLDRHGPMILGVCRRAVRDEQLAEDVFQATFLILARTADTITNRTSLSDWLLGVALRQAGKALARTTRARRIDRRPAPEEPQGPLAEASWREIRQILDEELRRLPERYRRPLILCHLDGRTRDEAAAQLGYTPGRLKGLLERGREQLRARLIRRGLAPAVTGAVLLTETALAGPVPPLLAVATLRCAVELASGMSLASCGAAAPVRSLLKGGWPMVGTKNMLLVLVCALIAGAGVFGMFGQPSAGSAPQALGSDEPAKKPAANSAPPIPEVPEVKDKKLEGTTVSGRVLTEPNGKPVVGHTVKLYRGGEPWLTTTTKTDDKGNYTFKAVKPGGYRVGLVYTEPHLWSEWGLVPPVVTNKPVIADDLFRTMPQSISGKVTDVETGEPVAKARINFSTADHNRDSIVTNEKGEYRLYVVAREVDLYCDGTEDRYEESAQRHKLPVMEGKEAKRIDFKVRGSPKFTGLVFDDQGQPVKDAHVLVEMRRDTLRPPGGYSELGFSARDTSLKTDNEGRFTAYMSIAYPRGGAKSIRFTVLARTSDQSLGGFVEAKADAESGFALDPLKITLRKTGSVKFRVLNSDGKPLEKAEAIVSRYRGWFPLPGTVKPQGKGRFEAAGLIPGVEYYIGAGADNYHQFKAVLLKSDETADAGDITIAISPDKAPGGPDSQLLKSAGDQL